MRKTEAPKLETQRLVLRRLTEADIPFMLRMFDDDAVRKHLGGRPPRDEHSMLKMVRRRHDKKWAVTLRDTGEYLGEVHIGKVVENTIGEIGYLFLREHWGKGYAREAVAAMMGHAFETLKLKRLWATVDDGNERSKKLLEKSEFKRAALLPESDFGGRVADVVYYTRAADGKKQVRTP